MEWFEATLEEKVSIVEDILKGLEMDGYFLTFQDLKKETGLTIKKIKEDILYQKEIAKQVGYKSVSYFFFPQFVPFDAEYHSIKESLDLYGHVDGEYCSTYLIPKGYDSSRNEPIFDTKILFNQKALEVILDAKKESEEYISNLESFESEFGSSGDPFED